MTNKEIARSFNRLGKIMELHNENPFKVRSYYNAYNTLRKVELPLSEMDHAQLCEIKGVGKNIADKILEMVETGSLATYKKYADDTPQGIIEMLGVRGFGPKKIKVVWKDMDITTIGELLYACNENRLIELKGFGTKTQEQLKDQLQYFLDSQGKYLYGHVEGNVSRLSEMIKAHFPDERTEITGDVRRKMPVIEKIVILTTVEKEALNDKAGDLGIALEDGNLMWDGLNVSIEHVEQDGFDEVWYASSASAEFLERYPAESGKSETEILSAHGLPWVMPAFREDPDYVSDRNKNGKKLLEYSDIQGVVHSHSTYSDGLHSMAEMAQHAQGLGYSYLVMTDHSKAAFYADGLKEDEVYAQMEEIDHLNGGNPDFKIYKGIEADILADGSMDYGDDFLQNFEVVIASVHTGLKMDESKATARIIKAIENPHTHILGHPTGRLLLSREGYPIDYKKILDACAAHNMVVELNANPLRLDLDWTWIPYALEKGIMISLNPDSHSREQMKYIKYGVDAAHKAGLSKDECLNCKSAEEFDKWVKTLK